MSVGLREIPDFVTVEKMKSPSTATRFRHQYEHGERKLPDGEYMPLRPEVVVVEKQLDTDDDPKARIQIVETSSGPWPYCASWGEWLTPDGALRLAALLTAAAHTVLNEAEVRM